MTGTIEPQRLIAEPDQGLSRRTILQSTAWAVPVVILATATPSAAGSLALVAETAGTMSLSLPKGLVEKGADGITPELEKAWAAAHPDADFTFMTEPPKASTPVVITLPGAKETPLSLVAWSEPDKSNSRFVVTDEKGVATIPAEWIIPNLTLKELFAHAEAHKGEFPRTRVVVSLQDGSITYGQIVTHPLNVNIK